MPRKTDTYTHTHTHTHREKLKVKDAAKVAKSQGKSIVTKDERD